MARHVHIHGFNGDCRGKTAIAISAVLGAESRCLAYDYSLSFEECLEALEKAAEDFAGGHKLHVTGISLGGFYAMQLRRPPIAKVTVWNPVVFPAIQLAPFLGQNIRFYDGREWVFTEESLLSYAHAPDPRQWNNFRQTRLAAPLRRPRPERVVLLGRNDDLLDPRLAAAFWQGHASVRWIDAGHDVDDFTHLLDLNSV